MLLYVAEANPEQLKNLKGIPIAADYEDADTLLVSRGGLESLYFLLRGINDKKDVFLHNEDSCYTKIIEALFHMYEDGRKDEMPFEYMTIESQFDEIIRKLEEKKNGKTNDGKTGKLL